MEPTFRDPAGSLKIEADHAVRSVHAAFEAEALDFVASGFYRRAVDRGDMVDTEVRETAGGLRLLHPLVRVATYPWEWTPQQWLAAAELTLRLGDEGLDEGWILKDATPLNVLFVGPRPVLVDVLSFERRAPGTSLWLAYGQYVRTFLLPLVMRKLLAWPLEMTLFKRDGYEPAELYAAMGWGKRLNSAAFWPITLPAMLERRKDAGTAASAMAQRKVADEGLAMHMLKRTLAGLGKKTRAAMPKSSATEWSEYTTTLQHYSKEEAAAKKSWVRGVLEELRPAHVLDVGANTGEFSLLAAECGAKVVALERDAEAADRIVRRTQQSGAQSAASVLTVHADLARPTPAVGWANRESAGLLARLEGKSELVMMLAVIHHLLLLEQIPLRSIMELAARLTAEWLVVEWVPVTDPMFVSLVRGREDLYGELSERDLMAACEGLLAVERREELTNGRVLLLFRKRS
jgi:SAM-dependent methyltransferase